MSTAERLSALSAAAERELREGILPFWAKHTVDRDRGGFYGLIGNDLEVDPTAAKGLVLNARILWAFSAVLSRWPERSYRRLADRAFVYLLERFWDEENSGLYWLVDHEGNPLDTRKQTYGQAFGIYAFSEYFRTSGEDEALERALCLFENIENHAFEPEHGGYVEALERDWSPLEDMRLSEIDLNAPYSQNTHLHLLEAYTTLYQARPDPVLRERLQALWEILAFRIRDPRTNRLILFQDRDWKPLTDAISYGHNIEASWLLCEAAQVLGDPKTIERTKEIALEMAEVVLAEGFDREQGGVSDAIDHHSDKRGKEWWPQAEAVVGFLNAYELSREEKFVDAAEKTWQFIDEHVIDHVHGEWYYRLSPAGEPEPELPKVSTWKCPYHNVRAALEVIKRVSRLSPR